MQRVLVTGAAGFVCSNIVDTLLDAGFSVIALDRAFDDSHAARWHGQPVETIQGDETALPDSLVDFVIHGAAITAGHAERAETPEANLRANLDPALTVSEWAHAHGVRRLIFISSSAVTRGTTATAVTEEAAYTPTGLYAVAKLAVEGLARTLRTDEGRDVLAVRLGYLYGPWERRRPTRPRVSLVAGLLEDALTTGHITVAAHSTPTEWTYVRDVGRALGALLQAPKLNHALYHLTSGQPLTQVEIAEAIQRALPGVTVDTHDETPPFRGVLVGERLRADTGFAGWTDFNEGLAETLAWFRRQMEQTR